jgi:hypothetical protein
MLTNEEFAKLDKARVNAARQPGKSTLHLALRHIEVQNQQVSKLYALNMALAKRIDNSLCRRVPRWFAVKWAQVKGAFRA